MAESSRDVDNGSSHDGWPAPATAEGATPASSWPAAEPSGKTSTESDLGWPAPAPVPSANDEWASAAEHSDPAPKDASGTADHEPSSEEGWPDAGRQQDADSSGKPTSRLIWMVAALIVIGLPVAVGVITFRQPVPSASGPLPEENLGAAAAPGAGGINHRHQCARPDLDTTGLGRRRRRHGGI